jgi:hypothetical protein
MKEAGFAAQAVRGYLNGDHRDESNPFAAYQLYCEKGADVLEDLLDAFWEHPLSFATLAYARYLPEVVDIFAGRVYERQPNAGLTAYRKLLHRERLYDNDDTYSIPIGSRYHPERAPLWEVREDFESTESWMGSR